MSTQEKFGFGMNEGRMLDLDLVDERLNDKLTQKVPSWRSCLRCGACVATCPVGMGMLGMANAAGINCRSTRLTQSGKPVTVHNCLLCGKCQLVCPRGIQTRLMAIELMKEIKNYADAV